MSKKFEYQAHELKFKVGHKILASAWHFGSELPIEMDRGTSVQLEKTFLFVGGYHNDSVLDTIWKFDVDNEEWILMEQKLKYARMYTAAFLVPDHFCK